MTSVETKRKNIKLAIKKIELKRTKIIPLGSKLSVSAVAKEAGVNDSLLYNS